MRTTVVGINPWLPKPLAESPWWTEPVPAERLAAVRIGVGLTLLLDVLTTYLPQIADFFGEGSVTGDTPFDHPLLVTHRLLLLPVRDPLFWKWLMIAWAVSGVLIAIGFLSRIAAAFAWFVSMSLVALNPMLHNAGDQVRTILLFMMAVSQSAAVWSAGRRTDGRVLIYPWPLRLMTVQLAVIYLMNGLFKALGEEWRSGDALIILMGDAGWIRWPIADLGLPEWPLRVAVWITIAWELSFPFLIAFPRTRSATLVLGVIFHLGTAAVMRVGMFPWYMLCLYLMFVPLERIGNRNEE